MLLYGKNSVRERLRSRPDTIQRVFLEESFDDQSIVSLLHKHRLPVKKVPYRELLRIKSAEKLQGVIAEVDDFQYADYQDIIAAAQERKSTPLYLDNIDDPQNLGAMIRTTACFGNFSLIIPKHNACPITETVLHVASGGENYVRISRVTNMSAALESAKEAGIWIAGTVVEGGEDIRRVQLPFPLGVVLGSEGKGVRPGVSKVVELKVRLPMFGSPLSFNVSIACGIICYEIVRQSGVGLREEKK